MTAKKTIKMMILTDTSTKARALRRLMHRQCPVAPTDGFLRDLPKTQLGVDPDNDFALKIITVRGKAALVKELRRATVEALRIYIATDPTDEGEALAAQYCELFGINPASKCRLEIRAFTKDELRHALDDARSIEPRAVEAYWTRRSLERLFKYGIDYYLWCAVYRGLSISPLQLMLLRMIARFEPPSAPTLETMPLDLKTLQLWAARDLKFAAGRVILIAQQLCEGLTLGKKFSGLIKYFRAGMLEPTIDLPLDELKEYLSSNQLKVFEAIRNGRVPQSTEAPTLDRPTDFTLMLTLEKLNIDWAETYSAAINRLVKGTYVARTEHGYELTELGTEVLKALDKQFEKSIDVKLFIETTRAIDGVRRGATTRLDVLRTFYDPFRAELTSAMKSLGDDPKPKSPPVIESDQVCEKCGRPMVIRRGRYGSFLACSGYPECKNARPYVERLEARCPECGGRLTARTFNRRRTFYGCERYPECGFWTWDEPQEKLCDQCGSTMLRHEFKDRPSMMYCSNERCPSRASHPINGILEKVRQRYEEQLRRGRDDE